MLNNFKFLSKGFDYLNMLVATCEITNFVLSIPIKSRPAQVVAEELIQSCMHLWATQIPDNRQRYGICSRSHPVFS